MYRIGVVLFVLPIFYGLTNWLDFASFTLPFWLRWTGFGISLLAAVVLLLSHQALGANWTGQLNIQENHVLVVRGIYTYVRHPMYLSFLLSGVGTLLLSANWFIGASLLIWFWIMYLGRINHEEQMMISEFGEQYETYMHSTGRLLPKIL
jgi:protein-S-isoprenylcysteine O-methyltransferase Ste14